MALVSPYKDKHTDKINTLKNPFTLLLNVTGSSMYMYVIKPWLQVLHTQNISESSLFGFK